MRHELSIANDDAVDVFLVNRCIIEHVHAELDGYGTRRSSGFMVSSIASPT